MTEPWESELNVLLKTVSPLHDRKKHSDTPTVTNIVGTVCILPPGHRLPLEAIAIHLGPCCQYTPTLFVAAIIKLTDAIADTTTLVFGSGKLVLVGALSKWHLRYTLQVIRLMIENVTCKIRDERIVNGTLRGHTLFQKCTVQNIVGNAFFGYKIDIAALGRGYPECIEYIDGSFPAAKANVYITHSGRCECVQKRGTAIVDDEETNSLNQVMGKFQTGKCPCTIKCLVFKTGKLVLIGARRPRDVNMVFHHMRPIVSQFLLTDERDMHEKRITPGIVQIKDQQELTEEDATRLVLQEARHFKTKRAKLIAESTTRQVDQQSPIMRLVNASRVDMIRILVQIDPEHKNVKDCDGYTAADRLNLMQHRTAEQEEMLKILNS